MPQMAPILWTILLVMFYMTLLLFMVKLYFYSESALINTHIAPTKTKESSWSW
uniref:ATP synthase complex subunit 8 n=1 Tax=Proasellus karamani TaxID=1281987 RepID=A0A485M763_9CRUS|nr:ATP synthase 8 [Proasellus karamani]